MLDVNVPGRIMAAAMRLAAMLATILVLQGCGHKGPLMLPAPSAQKSGADTSGVQASGVQATNPKQTGSPATGQNPTTQSGKAP